MQPDTPDVARSHLIGLPGPDGTLPPLTYIATRDDELLSRLDSLDTLGGPCI